MSSYVMVWVVALALPAFADEPPPDLALGKRLFEAQCALCHGQEGTGGRGPSLKTPRLRRAPDESALRAVISNGIGGKEMPPAWQLHPDEVISVAAYVRSLGKVAEEPLTGNAARGSAIYAAQGCASCHILEGQGRGFGPELTEIGARRSASYLRESLLKPAAAAPDSFLVVEAVTSEGHTVRGVRMNEDSFTIQLKDAALRFHSFRKSELKALRKLPDESPMPACSLPAAELEDLVAYLASLRGKP
jgi:cytochrome c oxidase cbb3-type subunit III